MAQRQISNSLLDESSFNLFLFIFFNHSLNLWHQAEVSRAELVSFAFLSRRIARIGPVSKAVGILLGGLQASSVHGHEYVF